MEIERRGPLAVTGNGYAQAWLRGDRVGDRDQAHVHEGLRLADGSGWVGVGGTICDNCARQVEQSIILCVMTTSLLLIMRLKNIS